ncbi:MAG TPA: hypothetical protein VGQ10_15305 [Vicinamibacterales bacterium]|jgi:hypothetical protein|nr:hypothetical protein [Vicinamibacterales bacterium]
MSVRVRYLATAVCATIAVACGGWDDTAGNGSGTERPPYVSPRETAGTSGSTRNEITITGCVVRLPPDEYVLSIDDQIAGQPQGTAGRAQSDPDVTPTDADRAAADAPHEQNPSAGYGRYHLTGSSEQFVSHVDREVEVKGLVVATDGSETPNTLRVESMRTTGGQCSRQ